jgi:hypothetical protein
MLYGVIGFDVFIFFFVLYFEWWRKRGRILIRIKTEMGERTEWKKPEKDGKTIIMEKEKKDSIGWKFTFSRNSLYDVKRFFRTKKALDVIYNAPGAVEYDLQTKKATLPIWDREMFEEIALKQGFKLLAKMLKIQLPTLFWLILIGVMLNIVLTILLHTGMIRIGSP